MINVAAEPSTKLPCSLPQLRSLGALAAVATAAWLGEMHAAALAELRGQTGGGAEWLAQDDWTASQLQPIPLLGGGMGNEQPEFTFPVSSAAAGGLPPGTALPLQNAAVGFFGDFDPEGSAEEDESAGLIGVWWNGAGGA